MRKVELHLKLFISVIQSRQLVRTPQRTGTIVSDHGPVTEWILLPGISV